MSLTMTPMTPMTPAYFLSSTAETKVHYLYNIYIIYNNATANYPHSQEINTPTVITVIVIIRPLL